MGLQKECAWSQFMKIYVSANFFETQGVILDAVNLCNVQQCTVASYWFIHLYT